MHYESFEPEDFATDAFFCSWVLHPTPEAELFWLDWLRNNPSKTRDIELARQMVLLASSDEGAMPGSETIERIWQGIEDGKSRKTVMFGNRVLWLKVAAAVILLLVAFGGYFYRQSQGHIYHTAFGESRRVLLPDGSLVTLNANSSLRVADRWGRRTEREVWLEGEAFFSVSKLKKAGHAVKFTVHTHDLNVEVRGTEFNVNTRQDQTRVVLSEGLVHLQLNDRSAKEIQMKPGDLVDFSRNRQQLRMRHLPDASPMYSWKNNRWTLNDASLAEIAVLIRETYGVTVNIETDSLKKQTVNGVVPTDNMGDLLSALESILPITITHEEQRVTIRGRPN
ncbi:FecR domain-containing protein [Dyadobacter sp. CY261]|uniref:FecR family protein n=1 Tax=Dyadobacter sp. CY261 TaxID=2907203 RepID=UPI001F4567FE|nr:FecR domain-containing protein [Dyadobacter sp. CY261]MCF0071175.1 FecR domain-containing protein [Dyadobacter sp. CY261]